MNDYRGVGEQPKPSSSNLDRDIVPAVGANPTAPATSHTVALIRMGEDGKITYGGDKAWIRELVSRLVAAHD